jgi:probable rRNA maturation factor
MPTIALKRMLMANDSQLVLGLEVQYAIHDAGSASRQGIPTQHEFHSWVAAALVPVNHAVEMVIRVVDEQESRQLNGRYRGKDKPTNVLSFPFEAPAGVDSDHLGDLAICAAVVRREAREQQKKAMDHWAHIVVHGVLHLRGLDHQTEAQAREMEELEKQILAGLGVKDPYQPEDTSS